MKQTGNIRNYPVMINSSLVTQLANDFLEERADGELFLVSADIKSGNVIEVLLDKASGVCIEECMALSRYIEQHLDRDAEDFELMVSSAGLTMPLKVLRQYQNCINTSVEVLVKGGIKEKGVLLSADENKIVLRVERMIKPEGAKRKQKVEEDLNLPMADILQTKRIITL